MGRACRLPNNNCVLQKATTARPVSSRCYKHSNGSRGPRSRPHAHALLAPAQPLDSRRSTKVMQGKPRAGSRCSPGCPVRWGASEGHLPKTMCAPVTGAQLSTTHASHCTALACVLCVAPPKVQLHRRDLAAGFPKSAQTWMLQRCASRQTWAPHRS